MNPIAVISFSISHPQWSVLWESEDMTELYTYDSVINVMIIRGLFAFYFVINVMIKRFSELEK